MPAKLLVLTVIALTWAAAAEVEMQKIEYGGWPNCIRLSNGEVELIATTDVGPRIIRFGFVGGRNVLKEFDGQMGQTGGDAWRIYGGHRLWHAPEVAPRTYAPDNEPVEWEWDGATLTLTQQPEEANRVQKQMAVTMNAAGEVRVMHGIVNLNPWAIELSPWALTVMAPGGRAIVPQEEYKPHDQQLLPARPIVLWHYARMADPRWIWGDKFIQLRHDPDATTPQKAGMLNKQGWAAYYLDGDVFIKRYGYIEGAAYPDYGVNTELFTNAQILEVETLGPLVKLEADGGSTEHEEVWSLIKADITEQEDSIERAIGPAIR